MRAVELGAWDAFHGVLRELDDMADEGKDEREAAAHTTSVLAATTARSDARLATRAVRRFVLQAGTGAESSLTRRRGLWRVGAAALAAGTSSVAVDVTLLLAGLGDAPAVRIEHYPHILDRFEGVACGAYRRYSAPGIVEGEREKLVMYQALSRERSQPSKEYLQAVAKTVSVHWTGSNGGPVTWREITVR